MKQTKLILVCAALFLSGFVANAQATSKKLTVKKGEVLDILLFAGNPNFQENFKKYRETAFVFATKTGYQPQPLFKVIETTQGGYQPSTFVFGKWPSVAARKKFLAEIVANVPDFHDQRRTLWSSFYLAYYEMAQDFSFEFDTEKIYVATAYWKDGDTKFNIFKNEWIERVKKKGGKVLIELKDAQSSVGYMYKPDYVVLTEWNDRESFNTFLIENKKMESEPIQNVNQFIIQ